MDKAKLAEIIAQAKAKLAAKQGQAPQILVLKKEEDAKPAPLPTPIANPAWSWNEQQTEAINNGLMGRSFVLIGAAGTGKTTTLRGMLQTMLESNRIPMLEKGTQYLKKDAPGVALVSYTRRAVRNIARQMPEDMKDKCLTIHKLLEFAPEKYYVTGPNGEEVAKFRFAPSYDASNKLPRNLRTIVIDESSMVSLELFDQLVDALPNPHAVQFIFLGDLNQLPPVYGHPILGQKLLQLNIVELTQVYRQALESPIIALATAIRLNKWADFNKNVVDLWTGDRFRKADGSPSYAACDMTDLTFLIDKKDPRKPAKLELNKPGRGKVTIQVWKKRVENETGLAYMQGQLKAWIDDGSYKPDEDLVLCPWGKSFGTTELNKAIADKLGLMREAEVHEIIAGFNKYYYAVGDKVMIDKQEAIITRIQTNPKYLGKRPIAASKTLNRWGEDPQNKFHALADFGLQDFEEILAAQEIGGEADEGRVEAASHQIVVRFIDTGAEGVFDRASTFNTMDFAYAITVHKAQGSECRKVFFITHHCHSAMCYRELVYTAITRAAEELVVVCTPYMLGSSAAKPRIKGDTLAAKLKFYEDALKERLGARSDDVEG